MEDLVYLRQEKLDLNIPNSVAIIGIGGVGSWVAFNLALTGVNKIILVDHDKIDEHNLNRTPFRKTDIGKLKVRSMMELIIERRPWCTVIPIPRKIEDIDISFLENIETIVDCRDVSNPLPEELIKKVKILGGYDGYKVTIHVNPDYSSIWGNGPVRYRIVPSWLIPPQFIANIITLYLCKKDIKNEKDTEMDKNKEIIVTNDIRHIMDNVINDERYKERI